MAPPHMVAPSTQSSRDYSFIPTAPLSLVLTVSAVRLRDARGVPDAGVGEQRQSLASGCIALGSLQRDFVENHSPCCAWALMWGTSRKSTELGKVGRPLSGLFVATHTPTSRPPSTLMGL